MILVARLMLYSQRTDQIWRLGYHRHNSHEGLFVNILTLIPNGPVLGFYWWTPDETRLPRHGT